jgi:D-proline reductase (dithiol) PrdB
MAIVRMMQSVAELHELPLSIRVFLKAYRWRTIDPLPWAVPRKPLHAARVALVSTAGLVLPSQPPFDDAMKGGDWSYREIPDTAAVTTLVECHRSKTFDRAGIDADANLAFPLDRLHELVRLQAVGAANRRHFSLMGSITAPGRLVRESAPAVARALVDDDVDAVLLIPI